MLTTEKQFNTKSTTDAFDEIYNNIDISVKEDYLAMNGYPFDYPKRWLNDPSMNKRIAIRRLDVIPSTHQFTLMITAPKIKDTIIGPDGKPTEVNGWTKTATIPVTEHDNLIQVLDYMCREFTYEDTVGNRGGLRYYYDNKKNELELYFLNFMGVATDFKILEADFTFIDEEQNLENFLKFLNQDISDDKIKAAKSICTDQSIYKEFKEVWNRDRLYIHASFSTSRRHFIGKRGDFYQNLTLLYPPPTNESTFYIRFTSNGEKNILIRYCEFDIQLCFIVNYKKATIL